MRKTFFLFLLCMCVKNVFPQSQIISGHIADEKGDPVVGASVIVIGTKTGTLSDTAGNFSLLISGKEDSLRISFVGYLSTQVKVTPDLQVVLRLSEGSLSEVQIVGYGSIVKTNITGSASTVKEEYLENKPFSSVDKTLQGAVAGLASSSSSGAPGSFAGVIIRGYGTLGSNPFPLWVIDGAIATTGDQSSIISSANTLSSLNPDDIESVTVLKDAATTAIYGSRGANGVILVTTKKGKAGKTIVNFSAEGGKSSIAYKPQNKPLTSLQYQTILRESVINAGLATDNAGADVYISDPNGLNVPADYTQTNTNWLDVVSQVGNQSQYNLSLSGGSPGTQYYASAGVYTQDGTTIATNYKRYNGSLTVANKINDKFNFRAALSGSAVNQNTPQNGASPSNPVYDQSLLLPWYTPYNPDGSLRYLDPAGEFPNDQSGLYNPVVIAAFNTTNYKQNTIRGNVSAEYNVLDNLKLTSTYSAEYFDIIERWYHNPIYGSAYPYGSAASSYERIFDWTWTNLADYRQHLTPDIYFDVKLGYEAYAQNVNVLQAIGHEFPDNLSLQYLASSSIPIQAYSDLSSNSTASVFTVADFNYKDRYVVSGSFRRDGSSVFGADNKWGSFFSVGGAWNVNNEAFLKENKSINLLKLRASYGTTGNQGIGDYTSLATFGYGINDPTGNSTNYNGNNGSALTNVGNPNLTWEKNAIFDLGVDFGFLKNRLSGTIDYYNRTTSNLIIPVPLSLTAGVVLSTTGPNTQNRNAGAVNNKGLEISLGGKPIVTRYFVWNINVNFATNKNTVTELYQGLPIPNGPSNIDIGHNIFEYYMPIWAGVNPGDGTPLWFTDGTKSKTTGDYNSAQPSFSGLIASPKYFGSLSNAFTYKGFSLSIQIYYNWGNYLQAVQGSAQISDGLALPAINQLSQQLSSWQKKGDVTSVPQIILGGNNLSDAPSTRYLYNDDYIRLRDVTLNYAFSGGFVKRNHINLTVYVRATNLLTYVKDKNMPFDPEEGGSQVNFDVYQPKIIAGGVKLGF
jgi:TonB-linked SusC/RagA family outer membrane protein